MVTVKPSSIKSCAPNFKDVAKHEPFGKYLHIDAKSVSVQTSDKNHRSTLRAINKFVSSEILSTSEFSSKKYTLYDDLKEITIGFDKIVDGVNKKKTTLTIWQKISNGFFAIFGTGIYVESIKAANISKSLHAKLTDLEGAVKKRNDFLATVSGNPRAFLNPPDDLYQDDEQIVLAAIKKEGYLLWSASPRLQEQLLLEREGISPEVRATFSSCEGNIPATMKKTTLMKIIEKGCENLRTTYTNTTSITLQQHEYIVIKENHSPTTLKVMQVARELGSGTFGVVREVHNFSTSKTQAMKMAKDSERSLSDVRNEYEMLSLIHQHGEVMGLQAKPYAFIDLTKEGKRVGYTGKKYDSDLASASSIAKTTPIETKVSGLYQLMYGLSYLKKIGVIHGDIKPENILIKKRSAGDYRMCLSDLGGARKREKADGVRVHTCAYTSPNHANLGENHFWTFKNRRMEVLQKNDLLALGITAYQMLTNGKYPFITDYNGYPTKANFKTSDFPADVPDELTTLLQKIINLDPDQQINVDEALLQLANVIKTYYPDQAKPLVEIGN